MSGRRTFALSAAAAYWRDRRGPAPRRRGEARERRRVLGTPARRGAVVGAVARAPQPRPAGPVGPGRGPSRPLRALPRGPPARRARAHPAGRLPERQPQRLPAGAAGPAIRRTDGGPVESRRRVDVAARARPARPHPAATARRAGVHAARHRRLPPAGRADCRRPARRPAGRRAVGAGRRARRPAADRGHHRSARRPGRQPARRSPATARQSAARSAGRSPLPTWPG